MAALHWYETTHGRQRARDFLRMRADGRTEHEIAKHFDVTQDTVSKFLRRLKAVGFGEALTVAEADRAVEVREVFFGIADNILRTDKSLMEQRDLLHQLVEDLAERMPESNGQPVSKSRNPVAPYIADLKPQRRGETDASKATGSGSPVDGYLDDLKKRR